MLLRLSWVIIAVAAALFWIMMPALRPHAPASQPATMPTTKPAWSPEGRWEPLSRVYDKFGGMTVTPTRVTWDSGQGCEYQIVRQDDDSVTLRLMPPPVLHDTSYPLMRLQRRAENPPLSSKHDIEVSFFEGEARAKANKPEMWGVYLSAGE